MRLFTGSSAQDAAETALPELSPEVQELYERYLAGDALMQEEHDVLNEAFNKNRRICLPCFPARPMFVSRELGM